MLEAGAVRVCITPPLGIRMQGYAVRDHGAEGVHDDLHARVLALRDGGTEAVLIACDLCHMPAAAAEQIRREIGGRYGIPPGNVMVHCTHTHSGPALIGSELEERYKQLLVDHVAGAVGWALRCMAPVRIRTGRLGVRLGINRRERTADGRVVIGRNPDGPLLPHADYALLSTGERPVAVLFSHACHPTTLSFRNYDISADFPGAAQEVLEPEFGCPALFLQGACADVNPSRAGSFADTAALGRRLAFTVLKGVSEAEEREPGPLAVRGTTLDLPLESDGVTIEQARREAEQRAAVLADVTERLQAGSSPQLLLALWDAERQARWARERYEALQAGEPLHFPCTLQALTIGDLCFLGLPAEIFASIGLEIAAGSPYARTVVLGYTNGYFGYFPDSGAWDLGGYEVDARVRWRGFPLAREAHGALVQGVRALLRDTYTGH